MNLKALAAEFGFVECYVFKTEPFIFYERRLQDGALHSGGKDLDANPSITAPWANTLIALIYPYRPFTDRIPVSGNYPSSNAAFLASKKMMSIMRENGIPTERAHVPVRELLTRAGAGIPLKNGLTYIPKYGTRFSVQVLLAELPEPDYSPVQPQRESHCKGCLLCEQICSSKAIDEHGYNFQACARAYMGGDPMEPWVMDAMTCMLGCELCQKVCPYNDGIDLIDEMPDAFRLEEILAGNIKPVLEIVGKNLNKNGRIIQHACVIAAKQGRTDLIPLIEPWLNDEREGVRVAAQYALEKLRV